jgi:hypothetical protein
VAAVFPDPAGVEEDAFRLVVAGATGSGEEEEPESEGDFGLWVADVGAGANVGCDFRFPDADVSEPSRGFIWIILRERVGGGGKAYC